VSIDYLDTTQLRHGARPWDMSNERDPDKSLGQHLGEFVASAADAQLPAHLKRKAREHLLDTLGVAIAARRKTVAITADRAADRFGGLGPCSLWGSSSSNVSVLGAAFANGVAAHCLDFDDTHLGAIMHPSCVVMPAALAVAQASYAELGQFVHAIGVGWEVACRLGLVAGDEMDRHGLHVTGILGPFGAAAAVGHLMNLSSDKLSNAFGLCCSQGSGTHQSMIDGSWNKAFHAGWASQSGTASVLLAHEGFLGSAYGLEGARGLFATLLPRTNVNLDLLSTGLGEQWACSEIALKPYSCCHLFHSCLDCVQELTRNALLAGTDIDEVICIVPQEIVGLIGRPVDATAAYPPVQTARFSLPICLAMLLSGFAIGADDFCEAVVNSEAIRSLAGRVRCIGERFPDYPENYPGQVTLRLRSGGERIAAVNRSRGTCQNPLSMEALIDKFFRNVGGHLPLHRAQEFSDYVLNVEETEPTHRLLQRLEALVTDSRLSQ
jgi:2-methylcitrate dehydratase PrpD